MRGCKYRVSYGMSESRECVMCRLFHSLRVDMPWKARYVKAYSVKIMRCPSGIVEPSIVLTAPEMGPRYAGSLVERDYRVFQGRIEVRMWLMCRILCLTTARSIGTERPIYAGINGLNPRLHDGLAGLTLRAGLRGKPRRLENEGNK